MNIFIGLIVAISFLVLGAVCFSYLSKPDDEQEHH